VNYLWLSGLGRQVASCSACIVCENATTALAAGINLRKWREICFSSMICAAPLSEKLAHKLILIMSQEETVFVAAGTLSLEPECHASYIHVRFV
jgi:hypothetical protein